MSLSKKITKQDLEGKSLHELLNNYSIWHGETNTEDPHQKDNCQTIHDFIIENFTEKLTVELRKAYNDVDSMDLPSRSKDKIKQVKYCAFDITQRLDPMHISSIPLMKKIIEERISITEEIIKNIE